MENEEIVLEEAYFHISNGGLTLSVVHDPPDDSKWVFSIAHLKVELTCFAIPLTVKIPLGSPEVVFWLHKVTGRLLDKMMNKPNCGRHIHFGQKISEFAGEIHPGHVFREDEVPRDYKFVYDENGFRQVVEDNEEKSGEG